MPCIVADASGRRRLGLKSFAKRSMRATGSGCGRTHGVCFPHRGAPSCHDATTVGPTQSGSGLMKQWTIRGKLRAAFGVLAALVCALSFVAGFGLQDAHRLFAGYVNMAGQGGAPGNEGMETSNARDLA